ncbi:MAG: hypothetical protein WCJ59_00475 [bacterium]
MKTLRISNQVLFWYFAVVSALNILFVSLMTISSLYPETMQSLLQWLGQFNTMNFLFTFSTNAPLAVYALLAIIYGVLLVLKKKNFNLFSTSLALGVVGGLSYWILIYTVLKGIKVEGTLSILTFIILNYIVPVAAIVTGIIAIIKEVNVLQSVDGEDISLPIKISGKASMMIRRILKIK